MSRRPLAALHAPSPARMLTLPLALTAALGLMALTPPAARAAEVGAAAGPPAAVDPRWTDGVYVVEMADLPVAAYDGSVTGYTPTRPSRGAPLDASSPAVERWVARLVGEHARVVAAVGGPARLYDYAYAYNGFAARLTAEQAQQLRRQPGVLAVARQRTWTVDTTARRPPDPEPEAPTPTLSDTATVPVADAPSPTTSTAASTVSTALAGLDGPDGLWSRLGGSGSAGEGVVVGLIDTGIWPEAPAFADRLDASGAPTSAPTGRAAYAPLPGWAGRCQAGDRWPATTCGGKVVAARYFTAGLGGDAAVRRDRPWEYVSPRDRNGHGTFTASTAVGNDGQPVTGPAAVLAPGGLSGVAPRARLAVYKALWSTEAGDTATGTTSDLVAAVDRAVADGVDVISYSDGGSQSDLGDPAEVAFLFAAGAGVFVATSAGNSGPSPSTVAHPSPWVTTVAAGTRNRDGAGSVTLGDGRTFAGASLADRDVTAPLVDARAAGVPGTDRARAAECAAVDGPDPVLDRSRVEGHIVVCERGTTARADKSRAVADAGGVGMVLVNPAAGSLDADLHAVPTVHLPADDLDALRAYAASAGASATIHAATVASTPTPHTASFSSRGPSRAASGDVLKPDLVAPGQDVLSAVPPPTGSDGPATGLRSGTSVSAPQVAGLAALIGQLHPSWSPMAVKSALMTTSRDALDGTPASPSVVFRQGAGHVRPDSAADPGLVYDSDATAWLAVLCGETTAVEAARCARLRAGLTPSGASDLGASTPGAVGVFGAGPGSSGVDPTDLNAASIAVGALVGRRSVTRTVTNVGGARATYTASVDGLRGLTTTVSPSTLTLDPGRSASFTVTLQRTDAALGQYTSGSLSWDDGTHLVRSPVVVRPVALEAPAEVAGAPSGTGYDVAFGYSGGFTVLPRGPVPATVTEGIVADDPTDSSCALTSPEADATQVTVPAGTTYARFALAAADGGSDTGSHPDLDLCVFDASDALVGVSASASAAEQVDLPNPPAGDYTVVVQGRDVAGVAAFRLSTWLLGSDPTGAMTVDAPGAASTGDRGGVRLGFPGLGAGSWLGSVAYRTPTGTEGATIVRVEVR